MDDEHDRIEVSPVGLGIALVGALAMLIAVFLPRVESTSFGGIAENTLIQSGDGVDLRWIEPRHRGSGLPRLSARHKNGRGDCAWRHCHRCSDLPRNR